MLSFSDYGIDGDLWYSYQMGLVVGVVLIMTLQLLFPGQDVATDQDATDATPSTAEQEQGQSPAVSSNAKSNSGTATSSPQPTASAPANLDKHHAPKAPERPTTTTSNNNNNATPSWSPHGQMNAVVYVVVIGVTVYLLNQEYHGIVLEAFGQYFPREAALLGLKKKE